MTRHLITAAMIAVASTVTVSDATADCHGAHCVTGLGVQDFHARFGCTPQEALLLFQKHPELITRFPEAARILQTQFGLLTTTAAVTPTPVAAATPVVPAAGTTPAGVPTVTPAATPTAVAASGAVAGIDAAATAADPVAAPPVAAPPLVSNPVVTTDSPVAATSLPNADESAAPNAAAPIADPVTPADAPAALSPADLEALAGVWINENTAADQPIARITLEQGGNAIVVLNTELGQTELAKPFTIDGDKFKLDGTDLARIVSRDANKVVLDSNGTELTFIRE
ncbi:MAG: hypothetical protein KF861_14555 [Planctomycetaceae bacterium]|nr:hypothetical protein [Planctomycetaceae bacterium]